MMLRSVRSSIACTPARPITLLRPTVTCAAAPGSLRVEGLVKGTAGKGACTPVQAVGLWWGLISAEWHGHCQ